MATNTSKYIIDIGVNSAGVTQSINLMKQVDKIFADLNIKYDKNSKLLDTNFEVYKRGGKNIVALSGIIEDSAGKARKFAGEFTKAGSGLKLLANTSSVTAKEVDKLGRGFGTAGINLTNLLTKSLQGILIYRVLGNAFTFLQTSIASTVKFFNDFEDQLAQVRIVSGESQQAINKLGAEALKIASNTGTSFTDLGEALSTFSQLGLNSVQILEQLAPVLKFSASSGRGVKDTVEDLVAIQTSFNLTSEDTATIFDILTIAQKNYSISTSQLSAALRKLGPVAGTLGLTLSETAGFIIAVQEQTRQSGEAVATALESIFGRLQSIETVGKLQSIAQIPLFMDAAGQATSEFTGIIRPTAEILAVLSRRFDELTEAEKAQLTVTLGGRTRFSEASALVGNYEKSVKAAIDTLLGFNANNEAAAIKLNTVNAKLKQLGGEFNELINTIRPVTNEVTKLVLELAKLGVIGAQKISLGGFVGAGANFIDSLRPEKREEELLKKREGAISSFTEAYKTLIGLEERHQAELKAISDPTVRAKADEFFQEEKKRVATELNDQNKKLGLKFDEIDLNSNIISQVEKIVFANDKRAESEALIQKESRKTADNYNLLSLKLKNLETEGIRLGKNRISIVREQLKLLESSKVTDPRIADDRKRLEDEKNTFELQIKNLETQSKLNQEISLAKSLGLSDLEIQKLKIEQTKENLGYLTDENDLRKEQLALEELILEKRAQASQELQNSVKSGISNFLQGKGTSSDILTGFTDTVKKGLADSVASSISGAFFKATGLGDAFGGLTTGIEGAFSSGSKIAHDAIVSAFAQGSSILSGGGNSLQSIQNGVINPLLGNTNLAGAQGLNAKGFLFDKKLDGTLQGVRNTGTALNISDSRTRFAADGTEILAGDSSGGLLGTLKSSFSGLFNKLGGSLSSSLGQAGGNGGLFSGLFDGLKGGLSKLFSGLGGGSAGGLGGAGGLLGGAFAGFGAFQSAKKGDIFGATAQGALAGMSIGGPYGAAIGGALGLFGSLFRKPKRTVDIQEQTREFQVSSRIDVTNKKLDIVNRNLVALKQTFETIVLPESAFLGTKRSLEDQFSVSSRRGIF